MVWKTQLVTLQTPSGPKEVWAHIMEGLAVIECKLNNGELTFYNLTHAATGLKIGYLVCDSAYVAAIVEKLATALDWTAVKTDDDIDTVRAAVGRFSDAHLLVRTLPSNWTGFWTQTKRQAELDHRFNGAKLA